MLKNNITQASLTIATSIVIACIFRGTTSLLSAMIIPLILLGFMYSFHLVDYLIVSIVLIFLTLTFITTQFIFMIIYTILGFALRLFVSQEKPLNFIPRIIFYSFIVTPLLFLGIILTELVFAIPLNTFMLQISHQSVLIYTSILYFEGIVISVFHFSIIKKLSPYILKINTKKVF